jgi:hypothetical protein
MVRFLLECDRACCDENGTMYEVTHTEEFDFSNDMEITDISLLDDIDFGF